MIKTQQQTRSLSDLRIVLFLTIFLTTTTSFAAAPFGISFGSKPSNYGCTKFSDAPGIYICKNVPKPHSFFETYMVQASQSQGICLVKGVGKTIQDSGHGGLIRDQMELLEKQLESVYGKKTETGDLLLRGALWKEPNEWLMAIYKNQRYFAFIWEQPNEEIRSIYVAANSLGSDKGYVVLEYYGYSHDACKAELNISEADSL